MAWVGVIAISAASAYSSFAVSRDAVLLFLFSVLVWGYSLATLLEADKIAGAGKVTRGMYRIGTAQTIVSGVVAALAIFVPLAMGSNWLTTSLTAVPAMVGYGLYLETLYVALRNTRKGLC